MDLNNTCYLFLGTIMSFGDISAQKLVEKSETWDIKRTLRFTIIGSCIVVSANTTLCLYVVC